MRIRIAREVARRETNLPDRTTRSWGAHLVWLGHTFFPPRQPLAMLRSWRDLPRLAANLAAAQRPTARVVVMGHVHFPGVWTNPPLPTVVNTGSFFSPLGGLLADVAADQLEVRRITRRDGRFYPGRKIAVLPLRE